MNLDGFDPTPFEGKHYKKDDGTEIIVVKISSLGSWLYVVYKANDKEYSVYQDDWNAMKLEEVTVSSPSHETQESDTMATSDTKSNLGATPELPPITFAYDNEKKVLLVLDHQGVPVDEISVMTIEGKDGLSAYQEWVSRQPKDSTEEDKSFTKFLSVFKGKDGKDAAEWTINSDGVWCCNGVPTAYRAVGKDGENGKSAYEQWAENQPAEMRTPEHWHDFLQGKDGEKGLSAFEEWKSLLPEERRNATLSDFFSWLVQQTEAKIDAKEGATWVPNFVDGKIVFQNDRTKAVSEPYTVKGKDGKSFSPKIVDEKLTFVDNDGNEVTPRYDYRGKSAFELWQELPGNEGKTLKDFFDFLKGEKGDPGLDGIVREAKHSYLDIKDRTCPVQKIDTSLLVNTSDSARNPEDLVDEKVNEIKEMRETGKRERASKFKEFFWWCAGADRALLRKCPGDHSKYIGIGSVILFTALMAWFSSFIAMQLVFPWWGAVLFATFWSAMIFFLDRFITNTMYSDGKVTISKEEFIGGLPRILIAIFLGIVISAPLELKIFEDEIETLLKNDLREEYQNKVVDKSDILAFAEADVEKWKQKVEYAEKNVGFFTNPDRSGKAYDIYFGKKSQKTKDGDKTTSKGKQVFNHGTGKYEDNNITTNTGASYETVRDDDKFDKDKFNADHKEKESDLKKANDSLLWYRSQIVRVKKTLVDSFDVDSACSKKGLHDRLRALHYLAMEGYGGDDAVVSDSTEVTVTPTPNNKREDSLVLMLLVGGICFILSLLIWCNNVKKWNIKKITTCIVISLLIGIIGGFCYDNIFRFFYFLVTPIGLIMLLFILIDVSPVLYKMMLADGVYDKYLHLEKKLMQIKERLRMSRMVRKIDESEIKALSPFIMGDYYDEMKELNIDCSDADSGDLKWGTNKDELDEVVEAENKKLFETVLEYKKRIILAYYSAWYRDMRDALIGSPDDAEGERISPEDVMLNDTNFDNTNQPAEDSSTESPEVQDDIQKVDIGSDRTSTEEDNCENVDNHDVSDEITNEEVYDEVDLPEEQDEVWKDNIDSDGATTEDEDYESVDNQESSGDTEKQETSSEVGIPNNDDEYEHIV